jgi:hypothetical protein
MAILERYILKSFRSIFIVIFNLITKLILSIIYFLIRNVKNYKKLNKLYLFIK